MIGPTETTDGWQQAVSFIALYVMLIVVLWLRKQIAQRREPKPQPKRERQCEQSAQRQFDTSHLDTSQPPSWWEDWEEKSIQSASEDEEIAR